MRCIVTQNGKKQRRMPPAMARRRSTIAPMPRFIAYLRAINVGGHIVKMDHLKALFEALTFSNVATFIASGNVIFDSTAKSAEALERRIEKHLNAELGYEVATFLRTPAENIAAAVFEPFAAADFRKDSRLYVAFLKTEPTAAQRNAVRGFATAQDAFAVRGREIFWLCHVPSHLSAFSAAKLEKTLGAPVTLRNSNTLRKLADKYPA
jgi:uncharacterized protein (DUF1697 family)